MKSFINTTIGFTFLLIFNLVFINSVPIYSGTPYGAEPLNYQSRELFIKSPGGITYKGGEGIIIKWESENLDGVPIRLFLYNENKEALSITKGYTANMGFFKWTLPASLELSNYYRIKLSTPYRNLKAFGPYFRIGKDVPGAIPYVADEKKLNVTFPVDTVIQSGVRQKIMWNRENLKDIPLIIQLYKGGKFVDNISRKTIKNNDSVGWRFPTRLKDGPDYQIVIKTKDGKITVSGGYFTVLYRLETNSENEPFVNSTVDGKLTKAEYKNKNLELTFNPQTVERGKEIPITWQSQQMKGIAVDVQLLQNNTLIRSLSDGYLPNTGQFVWKLDSAIKAGDGYQIKLRTPYDKLFVKSNSFIIK